MTMDVMGEYAGSVEVNGVTVYTGGTPASRRLRGTHAIVKVCCLSCAARAPESFPHPPVCRRILTDRGRAMVIEHAGETRCTLWSPGPAFARMGRSSGKVDSPEFVKWKCGHADIVADPAGHGKLPGESLHDFLVRMWKTDI